MEKNAKLEIASRIVLETGCSLFLTGKAGTGKTTFLREIAATTRKRMVVTAPTGIAAINAGGMTLHSFFQLDFAPFVPGMQQSSHQSRAFSKEKIKIIRGLDLLVIDEISMVRADVLDAVDSVLRRFRDRTRPFGGVQLLLIGDLQQLPPVVVDSEKHLIEKHYRSPYFFDSHALSQLDYLTIELTKVYRQNDREFINLLNAVRDNRADADVLAKLNSRCIPGFAPKDSEGYVRLTTHNHMAAAINRARLDALKTEAAEFKAVVTGNFPASSFPADEILTLKVGAQVMFIKNDNEQRRFYNGMMGKVTDIGDDSVTVMPDDGDYPIVVEPVAWENMKYVVNETNKEIEQKVDGVFMQLPLKTAWAITIHKSQGLTFDRAIIDATSSFSHGQTYVALSRCRTLEGMVLDRPLTASAIINDPTVTNFMQTHTAQEPDSEAISGMVHTYALHLATDMFNFRPIFNALEGVIRMYNENFMKIFPTLVMNFESEISRMRDTLIPVHNKFICQIRSLDEEERHKEKNEKILKRIKDASAYFLGQLEKLIKLTAEMPVEHDSKKTLIKLRERRELFEDMAAVRRKLMEAFREEDFDVNRYLDLKAEASFSRQKEKKQKKKEKKEVAKSEKSVDNRNPELYDDLRAWRKRRSEEMGVPVYTIMNNRTLLAIANEEPKEESDLLCISGIGKVLAAKYGEEILDVVSSYKLK